MFSALCAALDVMLAWPDRVHEQIMRWLGRQKLRSLKAAPPQI
jgi:hypothetical protein